MGAQRRCMFRLGFYHQRVACSDMQTPDEKDQSGNMITCNLTDSYLTALLPTYDRQITRTLIWHEFEYTSQSFYVVVVFPVHTVLVGRYLQL